MTERYLQPSRLNYKFIEDATEYTFTTVDTRYGKDNDHTGEQHLRYHNGYHARAVSLGAKALGEVLELSREDIAIATFAGAAHDVVQLQGKNVNEEKSSSWAAEHLRPEIPNELIKMARLAILGTEPILNEDFIITGQVANLQDYPTKRAELVAKAVASADLGSLYTPEGPLLGHEFYRELNDFNGDQTPEIDENVVAFQRRQLNLMRTYRYPLKKAEDILATHRSQVEAHTVKTLEQLERGEVHTWEQLVGGAMAFNVRHL